MRLEESYCPCDHRRVVSEKEAAEGRDRHEDPERAGPQLAAHLGTVREGLRRLPGLTGLLDVCSAPAARAWRESIPDLAALTQRLEQAERELHPRYGFKPSKPILIEFYPRQEDFAVRTLGFVGGDGFTYYTFTRENLAPGDRLDVTIRYEKTENVSKEFDPLTNREVAAAERPVSKAMAEVERERDELAGKLQEMERKLQGLGAQIQRVKA